jgi:type I restriction enzyme S subunit
MKTTIGEQATLQRGIDITKVEQRPGIVPVISSGGISSYHDTVAVRGPGVVLGRKGVVGSVFYVEEDYWPHDTSLWVKDFHGNFPRFVYYFFKSVAPQIARMDVGSANPTLNRNHVHPMPIIWPPLPEQRAIAGVLGALDDKIESNRRTSQTLEKLARAIFRAWFVDFEPVKAKSAGARSFPGMPQAAFDALPTRLVPSELGPVPEAWRVVAFSSICILMSGGTPKRSEPSYWKGDVPWYSVRDAPIDGAVWVIETDECISKNGLENSAAQIVPKGCTIISARGTVGKLALVGRPMAFNQSCFGLLPADHSSFYYTYLLTKTLVSDLQQRTHGSVFDTINRATFDGLLVTTPPFDLASSFEGVVVPLFNKLLVTLQESKSLASMRDYLLPKLLSGAVRVAGAERFLEKAL